MKKNSRKNSANKAAQTVRVRRSFVEKFSQSTLDALVDIVKNVSPVSTVRKRSLAAYKANLTRGTYRGFVSVKADGTITRDRLGLTRKN